jgi:hypothetical protein
MRRNGEDRKARAEEFPKSSSGGSIQNRRRQNHLFKELNFENFLARL